MLALTDQQLAMLAIGATRIAPDERAAWLEQLARKLDPQRPRRASARQQRWRARQKNGRAMFRVEANHDALLLALIETGRLSEAESCDRRHVERAISIMLDDFSARWK
jgi:hypothetical protein